MGIKPTRDQRDEAVEYTRELLIRALHTGQIKTALRGKFPWIVSARSCANYIARARKIMLSDLCLDREAMRAQSIGRYDAILRTKDVPEIVKVRAQERIDKLLGLESPVRTELSGPDGKPIAVTAVKPPIDFERLRELERRAFGLPPENCNGEPVHPAQAASETGTLSGNGHG